MNEIQIRFHYEMITPSANEIEMLIENPIREEELKETPLAIRPWVTLRDLLLAGF